MWHSVSNPIAAGEHIPAERKTVLVWLREIHLPFCGYIRYAAGDSLCPYFVVYHGNRELGSNVVAWCDCLPDKGPEGAETANTYTEQQATGRGFGERLKGKAKPKPSARANRLPRLSPPQPLRTCRLRREDVSTRPTRP